MGMAAAWAMVSPRAGAHAAGGQLAGHEELTGGGILAAEGHDEERAGIGRGHALGPCADQRAQDGVGDALEQRQLHLVGDGLESVAQHLQEDRIDGGAWAHAALRMRGFAARRAFVLMLSGQCYGRKSPTRMRAAGSASGARTSPGRAIRTSR